MNCYRKQYEQVFSETVGALGARAFLLGRQAMVVLLRALGVNAHDSVGVCAYTCYSVAEAVKVCGAKPVYLDVDEYFCIDPSRIQRIVKGQLKVVVLQHTYGNPGRLDELLEACQRIGAQVIEDCAHALGCSWKGKPLGQFGQGAIYSFEWGKPYTTGQGGMLAVNSAALLEKVDAEIEKDAKESGRVSEFVLQFERLLYAGFRKSRVRSYIIHKCDDFLKAYSRLDPLANGFCLYPGYIRTAGELTARAGLKQLKDWPKSMNLRRRNVRLIESCLAKAGLSLYPISEKADITLLRYPVPVRNKLRILQESRERRLDIAGGYESPVYPVKAEDLASVDYQMGSCLRAEEMANKFVYLPTGLTMNEQHLQSMMAIICRV